MKHALLKDSLGSRETAENIASRAEHAVVAYRKILSQQTAAPGDSFDNRPLTDKQSYLLAFPFAELLGDDYDQSFTIFRSSGSSGHSFYWPQLKQSHHASAAGLRAFLESAFEIHKRRSLAIVGLALGSWIGGDHFSWALKSVAIDAPYPFGVFSPGSRHDEIIEMIRAADKFVDQIILYVCPSAIAHLQMRAEQRGLPLPLKKLRYVVIGEPFPESLRGALQSNAGIGAHENFMFSIYGSADTGVLGFESPASVAMRKLLAGNQALATSLGFGSITPHLFHWCAPDAYVESLNGELCITRWQGIPLVRYNLHDTVHFLCWQELQAALGPTTELRDEEKILAEIIRRSPSGLPDLLAITGRADRCLILCGTNLTETMFDEAVKCAELSHLLTGTYRAKIAYEGERQRLEFDLEFKQNAPADRATEEAVYHQLVQSLGRAQPEFLDDWQNVYRVWDDDPAKRILKLNYLHWPALSQTTATQIKQRSVEA